MPSPIASTRVGRRLQPIFILPSAPALLCAVLLFSFFAAPSSLPAQETGLSDEVFRTLDWRNVGPYRGGRVVAVHGVPEDPETYYMGSTGGGVWRTTDGGETWSNLSDGFFGTGSVGAIAVAPSDPNVIYVGMGEHPVRGVATSHGDGVYRSTDRGRTWIHLGLENTRHISRIRVDPRDPDRVFVGAQGAVHGSSEDRGVYRSVDGGETWEKVLYVNETSGVSALAMDPTNPRILYAAFWDHLRRPWHVRSGGPGSGIWKSTDGGETWSEVDEGLPELMGKIGVDVSPADPDRIFAIVEAEPDEGGLYRSDDGGESWRHVNGERVIQTRSWYYMKVFAHPTDRNTVIVLNAPFNRSIDGGRTFTQVEVGHGDTHDLWINPREPDRMILGDDGGAEITSNAGESWTTLMNQPTAQFYRVIADAQFPYHLYSGQQDNSAIGIANAAPGGIGRDDFYSVSGCETAYLAFDPEDPRYVYGNCYQGLIDRWDRTTGRSKPVQPYPFLGLGVAPEDQPYRFNWNAPVVADPHDPQTIYFGGNVLFRTRDRGQSWEEISPDLTRDEEEKHGPGGGPITNEAAGGENYNTIMYVQPSPLEEGTIWVGSDDGLVHLTRDGGESWTEVTPPDLEEGMINSIEASPHEPGKAYLAFTRYKFNDHAPHIYRTRDYGQTWTRIVEGIEKPGAWVRVVREDTRRDGLLFAGTEVGMYLSFDDGETWREWQLNLPVVPVTDLKVHQSDLLASTQGRGFWILDELAPVRQMTPETAESPLHLFRPQDTHRVSWGGGFGGGGRVGENPPSGVEIHFLLGEVPDSAGDVTLEIVEPTGRTVRTYHAEPEAERGPGSSELGALKEGLNRVLWDFRHEPMSTVHGLMSFGSTDGRMAAPGAYEIRLSVGERTATTDVRLLADPRWDAPEPAYREQDAFLAHAHEIGDELYRSVDRLRSIREQVESVVERVDAAEPEVPEGLRVEADSLLAALDAWESTVVQPRQETFQDVINFPNRLDAQVLHLIGSVDGTEPPLTDGARERLRDLDGEWSERRSAFQQLLGRVEAFNRSVRDQGIEAVTIPGDSGG